MQVDARAQDGKGWEGSVPGVSGLVGPAASGSPLAAGRSGYSSAVNGMARLHPQIRSNLTRSGSGGADCRCLRRAGRGSFPLRSVVSIRKVLTALTVASRKDGPVATDRLLSRVYTGSDGKQHVWAGESWPWESSDSSGSRLGPWLPVPSTSFHAPRSSIKVPSLSGT